MPARPHQSGYTAAGYNHGRGCCNPLSSCYRNPWIRRKHSTAGSSFLSDHTDRSSFLHSSSSHRTGSTADRLRTSGSSPLHGLRRYQSDVLQSPPEPLHPHRAARLRSPWSLSPLRRTVTRNPPPHYRCRSRRFRPHPGDTGALNLFPDLFRPSLRFPYNHTCLLQSPPAMPTRRRKPPPYIPCRSP